MSRQSSGGSSSASGADEAPRRQRSAPKGAVWLSAIPPHRPPVSKALRAVRAESRDRPGPEAAAGGGFAGGGAGEWAVAPTDLSHAIAAYGPPVPARKAGARR